VWAAECLNSRWPGSCLRSGSAKLSVSVSTGCSFWVGGWVGGYGYGDVHGTNGDAGEAGD
jgi:hypothetical protein